MSVKVKNLSFSYGKHLVLKDVSFELPKSQLIAVLGPNGAGKTTLFKCLLGLYDNYTGDIFINDKNIKELSIRQRAREVAYIPQLHTSVYNFEVIDVVMMSTGSSVGVFRTPGKKQEEIALRVLEKLGISELAYRSFSEISGGEQQLVLIARALAQNAKTIIMDEPTSSLDYGNTIKVLLTLNKLVSENMSIIMSTHQPEHALMYSNMTLAIHQGGVYKFGPSKDVVDKKLISEIYNISEKHVHINYNPSTVSN